MLFEVQMALFSRSFLRKRAISAATTLAVSAASLVLGQAPPATHRLHPAMTAQRASVQQAPVQQAPAETPLRQASTVSSEPSRLCVHQVHTFEAIGTSSPSPSSG
jgi:hypothetical protein